jgi:hypothetical protein
MAGARLLQRRIDPPILGDDSTSVIVYVSVCPDCCYIPPVMYKSNYSPQLVVRLILLLPCFVSIKTTLPALQVFWARGDGQKKREGHSGDISVEYKPIASLVR